MSKPLAHVAKRVAGSLGALLVAASLAVPSTASAQTPTPIAAIQAAPMSFAGTEVTVEGVVTVPINFRGMTFYSGYIQDTSGRGINIHGGMTAPPNAALLNTVGNRVRVTGEVQIFFTTTIEITNITNVTSLGTATPVPPIKLSTNVANDARWEGTLIEVAGTISTSAVASGARNYTLSDGSGNIVARVFNTLGIPQIADGTAVIGRGAGTNFQSTYQFYVGQAGDFAAGTPPADTAPPQLIGAWSPGGAPLVVTFDEPLQAASGGNAANYEVFETATPGNTVGVASVALAGPVATLTLATPLPIQTDFTLRVSNVQDTAGNALPAPVTLGFRSGGMADTTPPSLQSASAPSGTSITATFSESIDPATGGNAANYAVFETANMSNTVPVSSVAVSGATATLTLGSPLTGGTGYTLRASGIEDLAGNAMPAPETRTFTAPGGGGTCTGAITIASIHANPAAFDSMTVTVQGQVYIPGNSRGGTPSAYIQDSSGRGLNIFGSTPNNALLNDVGNVVCVTGMMAQFFTTVEIVDVTSVTLVSGGNPPLTPTHLTTGAAASPAWEGTFIEVNGTVMSSVVSGPGRNYTVNDGSGPVDVRVVNGLIGVPVFANGTRITARGAGSRFQSTFQILVGRTADVFEDTGGPDTTPPSLQSASAPNATSVTATFTEPIDPVTGGNAANYAVFETANMTNMVPVSSVAASGANATLTLGSPLTAGAGYTLRASGIEDLAGNVMPAPETRTFTAPGGGGNCPGAITITSIHANPAAFDSMIVTVQGQVYIPGNGRGGTPSAYIQDASGRGLNVFGSTPNNALLNDVGNVVCVTGMMARFFTTVEIVNVTSVTLVSSGNPPLTPTHLTTGAAASSAWEGTFIEVNGTVISSVVSGPGRNYTVNDGSGPVDVRVVNGLIGVPVFATGTQITARGAGGQFQTTFQILIGRVGDVFEDTGGPDTTPPSLQSASAPNATTVTATFTEAINTATGGNTANYTVFETANMANTVPVSSVAVSGAVATLTLGMPLTPATGYTLRASGISDIAGNVMPAPQTRTFTAPGGGGNCPGAITIASIHANPTQFDSTIVTVQGQVYIPANGRGGTPSAYIQDASGRGLNVFGSNSALLNDVGNVVCVTGMMARFFTTVEIVNVTSVTLVSSGNPPLIPVHLSTGAAASSTWEGTYIEVTGTVLSSSVSGPGRNYTVNDGSGPVDVRVVNTLTGIPIFPNGSRITARGAGSQFQSTFQILVGRNTDAFIDTGGPDRTPPSLQRAIATGGSEVTLTFSEALDRTSAELASNYEVFRGSETPIAATAAALVDTNLVRVSLGSSFDPRGGYFARARNVADVRGNAISPQGVTRAIEEPTADAVAVTGPAFTFLPRQGETYPITFSVSNAIAQDGEVLVRIFDLQGRLKKTLFDSRFETGNPFTANRATRLWDGRDDVAELVPAGTYIVHLLAVATQSGDRSEAQMPVVVATRLNR